MTNFNFYTNWIKHIILKWRPGWPLRWDTVENVVCQGDPWGSTECGVMVDGFGKDSLNPNLEPGRYKDTVEVPLLGIVDDILIVSQSGHKTSRMNGLINEKTAIKSSQFGHEKCHMMHIGKKHPWSQESGPVCWQVEDAGSAKCEHLGKASRRNTWWGPCD